MAWLYLITNQNMNYCLLVTIIARIVFNKKTKYSWIIVINQNTFGVFNKMINDEI